MFSKIDLKATLISTVALLVMILVIHLMPWLALILACFAFIPGIVLWYRSQHSFGLVAFITIVLSTLTGNVWVMSLLIITLMLSMVIAQLLQQRASKERIIYVSTLTASILILSVMMILQSMKKLPYADALLQPYRSIVEQAATLQNLDQQAQDILNHSIQQLAIQMPGMIVIAIAIYLIVALTVIFPILRKFKVATPVFRPLYSWQMKRSIFIMYALALLTTITTPPATTPNSIGINFQLVLGFLLIVQGLSFIHYFSTVKRMPNALKVLLVIVGIIFYPMTRLIGLLDLGLNLKRMIKNDKR
ncbi:DUF2232 domain-containing protein [Staphylococcus lutrae]|uniref:DUF2232 domain-containing protein n=1 Tax=Staphylococcus lutrae TaxID=155085 RepID=A0AAC9RSK2_9STAP|nr:DUF2232 domain-containing protein [Staphylococcus lutrae]ARJ50884.1 hypothetical protein B5P37_05900 [Staphylococcus lutrae]PNZ34138.1 DUF2232 domain-containing protein [Staphylococcus lutrae]